MVEIVKFLLEFTPLLTSPPVDGSIPEIYFIFVSSSYSKGKDKVSWLQFTRYLKIIDELGNGVIECVPRNSLGKVYDDPFRCFDRIAWINQLALALLLRTSQRMNDANRPKEEERVNNGNEIEVEIPTSKEEKLKYVLELIDGEPPVKSENDIYPVKIITNKKLIPRDINDTYSLTTRGSRLEQLEYLLNTPCASHELQRERCRLRTTKKPFYECCEDVEHAQILSGLTTFDKNTSYCRLHQEKAKKLRNDVVKCHERKMHFIPIIQSQTDVKLGDCSYLDTCHKMASCRYVHYGQLMPRSFQMTNESDLDGITLKETPKVEATNTKCDCDYSDEDNIDVNVDDINHYNCYNSNNNGVNNYVGVNFKVNVDDNEVNDQQEIEINENIRVWDYTRGEPTCTFLKPELPAQWINVDLTKIDLSILGTDYGIVIADPSWTIHMNLNYSSMRDEELARLRIDKLQREGLLLLWVTGRTLETGKRYLEKWGYTLCNEITWIKTSQLVRTISTGRTGHWLNHSKEHLLVGNKGSFVAKWLSTGGDPQILVASTRETSRKPDEVYGLCERLAGSNGVRKLELFGRSHNIRKGWITVGNQVDGARVLSAELRKQLNGGISCIASTNEV